MPEYSKYDKQQILELIESEGVKKTAAKTGINIKTLYTWRSRAKKSKEVLDENRIPMTQEEIVQELKEVQLKNRNLTKEIDILRSALDYFCTISGPITKSSRFNYIKNHLDDWSLQDMCRALDVTPQGYYKYLKRIDH